MSKVNMHYQLEKLVTELHDKLLTDDEKAYLTLINTVVEDNYLSQTTLYGVTVTLRGNGPFKKSYRFEYSAKPIIGYKKAAKELYRLIKERHGI